MTGYLFQARYALLRGLEEGRYSPGHSLSIEKFDDVAFEESGRPIELIQTKHHRTQGDVSDRSVDIWKTLYIWTNRIIEDPESAANTRLIFLTTNTAVQGSALSMLRYGLDHRDESQAKELLISAAVDSQNEKTRTARDAFLALSDTKKQILVNNIWVFDNSPNIIDLRKEIEAVLHYSAPPQQVCDLVNELEGWWFNQVIIALRNPNATLIPLIAIQSKVSELRERFKISNLVIDEEIEKMPPDTDLPEDDRTFIRQMHFIKVSNAEIRATVHDYYRAYEQRSKWAREYMLLDGDVKHYDGALCDAWHRRFLACTADVTEESDNHIKEKQGKIVFRWAREHRQPLRNRDEIWLSSGSFQMLADKKRIGWHPDYKSKLESRKDNT